MFGHGRDDWDTGDRLYPDDRDDLSGAEFDYVSGHSPATSDPWQSDTD